MTPSEIEAALEAAFNRCDAASCPLMDRQKQILLQVVEELTRLHLGLPDTIAPRSDTANPLDELAPDERQIFLQFVKAHEQQNRPWKIQLLNDWLQERDSGQVQFIRERYGVQWLNRLKPVHFAKYAEIEREEALKLKVGDRIEVSNALWEWVQETGPCSREWFVCTVIGVDETSDASVSTNCTIRFSNGAEYEIQGIYEWNRYNWRWLEE
jgi:hypothetical protein